jgi:hypothetical protein
MLVDEAAGDVRQAPTKQSARPPRRATRAAPVPPRARAWALVPSATQLEHLEGTNYKVGITSAPRGVELKKTPGREGGSGECVHKYTRTL